MSITTALATMLLGVIAFPVHKARKPGAPPHWRSEAPEDRRIEPVLELVATTVPEPVPERPRIPLRPHLHERAPPARPPQPRTAAKQFIAWLQDMGLAGELTWAPEPSAKGVLRRQGLWQLYLWHCDEINVVPLRANMLGEALGKLCKNFRVPDYSTGKRRKLTVYRIPETPDGATADAAGRKVAA